MPFFKKIIVLLIASVIFLPGAVLAGYGLETAGGAANLSSNVAGASDMQQLIGIIVGAGLSLLGVIFFLLILFAGFKWMTAMGKQEDIQKSKDILEAAIIGLVLVLAAYAIARFVFTNLGAGGEETAATEQI